MVSDEGVRGHGHVEQVNAICPELKLTRFRDTRTFVFKESTMAKTRPPYPPEFRRQMFELVRAGRSPEDLAQEFEPTAQVNQELGRPGGVRCRRGGSGLTTAEREELTQLRCRIASPGLRGYPLKPARKRHGLTQAVIPEAAIGHHPHKAVR
jgi:transposase